MLTVPWKLPPEAEEAAWESIKSVAPNLHVTDSRRCVIPRRGHYHPDVIIVFAGADVGD